MRIQAALRSVIFCIVAAAPALVSAQFQTPTSDELKMASDPQAPGAAAVFLNIDETANDPLHLYTFYARVKVLTEKGKALATVEIPARIGDSGITSVKPRLLGQNWQDVPDSTKPSSKTPAAKAAPFKIAEIKARTIHPDGTIVPLNIQPEDLAKLTSQGAESGPMAFTLPAVEPGSILEYTYTVRYDETHFSSPFWEVQRPYFIHKAHFAFTPFNDFLSGEQAMTSQYLLDSRGKVVNTIIWSPVLPAGAQVKTDSAGQFNLTLNNIPPVPDEEWMPPVKSLAYHVRFYYKNASSGNEFWTGENNLWTKEVDRLAEPGGAIHQAVSGLLAPSDTDVQKAAKLYKAVQTLDNTDFLPNQPRAGINAVHPAQRAEDVWSAKSGSSEDLSILYLAMLRAAGLSAYYMKVVDRDKGAYSPAYLSFDQFDGDLIILNLQGKEIFLDPGQKMCPFQTIHWKHAGASGIRQSAKGPVVATSPLLPYSANTLTRTGDISFEDRTHFSGFFRFIMTGQDALQWRQFVLLHGMDQAKERFDQWLQPMVPKDTQVHLDHFLALNDPDSNLMAAVNAKGSLDSSASAGISLPVSFFDAAGNSLFPNEAQRLQPIDMHYGQVVTDQVVYHLPSGLSVANMPHSDKLSVEHYAAFVIDAKSDADQITTSRSLARAFTIAGTAEYPNIRDFYQKVAAADQQQIILTASPAAPSR